MNSTIRFPRYCLSPSSLAILLLVAVGPVPLHAVKLQPPTSAERLREGVSASDWQGIRAAHEAWKHAIEPVKSGWKARNPAQQWTTMFDGRGFEAKPQSADWTWGLELRSYGAGKKQREVGGKPAVKTESHRLAYHWDDTVQEWFVNDGRGLEHGFSVQERPPGPSDAPLTFVLATRGPLRAAVTGDSRAVDYRDGSGKTVLTYSGLRVWDADGRELEARFALAKGGVTLQVDAKDARYPLLIDPVARQALVKGLNTEADDDFGCSVAIFGDTVVVGARQEDSNAKGINGNQADNSARNSGAAYVFVRSGSTWTQQAYLKASNTEASDSFGYSVAISYDTVVVGAPGEDSNAKGINGNQADNSASDSGAVYVFARDENEWIQKGYLKASNAEASDSFGYRVAIDNGTVVVGAPGEDSNAKGINGNQADNSASDSGAAYVFRFSYFFSDVSAWTWAQAAYLKASNTEASDSFGFSVAVAREVNGKMVVVGAPREDSNAKGINGNQADNSASDSGAAYVFVGTNEWFQAAYLKASNTERFDSFGEAVAVSADYAVIGSSESLQSGSNTVVVGAPREDSNAKGINGDQADNSAGDAGAVYVFVSNGNAWTQPNVWIQQAYLKASNTEGLDMFGNSVALRNDIAVVGAPGKRIEGTAGYAGAAYIFARNRIAWNQQVYIDASNLVSGRSVAVSGDGVIVGGRGDWAHIFTGAGADIASLKFLPSSLKVRAGKAARLSLLVNNDLTFTQFVWVTFSSSDPSVAPAPVPVRIEAAGKKKINQKAKTTRVAVRFYVPTAGVARITAALGNQSASCDLTASQPRK